MKQFLISLSNWFKGHPTRDQLVNVGQQAHLAHMIAHIEGAHWRYTSGYGEVKSNIERLSSVTMMPIKALTVYVSPGGDSITLALVFIDHGCASCVIDTDGNDWLSAINFIIAAREFELTTNVHVGSDSDVKVFITNTLGVPPTMIYSKHEYQKHIASVDRTKAQ